MDCSLIRKEWIREVVEAARVGLAGTVASGVGWKRRDPNSRIWSGERWAMRLRMLATVGGGKSTEGETWELEVTSLGMALARRGRRVSAALIK
jgi:hypothetical protein